MKKKMLLGVFAVITASMVGITIRAQTPTSRPTASAPTPSSPTYGKESTTVRVGSQGGACVVTEAPSPIGTTWGSTITVVVLGECGDLEKTIGEFRLLSPQSELTPSSPITGNPTVRRLAADVVVVEARIASAPAKVAGRVTYEYMVLVGGKPLAPASPAKGDGQAQQGKSPFLLSVCPMWPCD